MPRMNGQPFHGLFSLALTNGSEWVASSPSGLRMAMPQAWGDRIITPSRTAWPPTRVSSALSRASESCRAVWNLRRERKDIAFIITEDDSRQRTKRNAPATAQTRIGQAGWASNSGKGVLLFFARFAGVGGRPADLVASA